MTGFDFKEEIKKKASINEYDWTYILDETIIDGTYLTGDIHIIGRLSIKNCIFEDHFLISDWTFENHVVFEGCTFKKGFRIEGGTFKKSLDLKWITSLSTFSLSGGTFDKTSISFKDTSKVWIDGGDYRELEIGGTWQGDKEIEELVIINQGELKGLIKIIRLTFQSLGIIGENLKEIFLQEIKTNYFHLHNFTNSGTLKVFGLTPKNSDTSYFEMTNSNMKDAQFFRVNFDEFTEVIFVDSNVSDTSLINSTWSNDNYRGIKSPLFNTTSQEDRTTIKIKEKKQLQETFRQLKFVYDKQGDKINESYFYGLEMNMYNSILKWTSPLKEPFWRKLILILSNFLSNYGTSFLRPLVGLITSTFIIQVILVLNFEYKNICIVLPEYHDPNSMNVAIGEYFTLLNPLHKIDPSLQGWGKMWDLFSRILSSFFIYSLIRSSRRYLK